VRSLSKKGSRIKKNNRDRPWIRMLNNREEVEEDKRQSGIMDQNVEFTAINLPACPRYSHCLKQATVREGRHRNHFTRELLRKRRKRRRREQVTDKEEWLNRHFKIFSDEINRTNLHDGLRGSVVNMSHCNEFRQLLCNPVLYLTSKISRNASQSCWQMHNII
jgi:hypothetical protein